MACGGCLQMRHMMMRLVLGSRVADKLVPGARVFIQPPKPPLSEKEKVLVEHATWPLKRKPNG